MTPSDIILAYVLPTIVITAVTALIGGLGVLGREAYRLIRGRLSADDARKLDLAAATAVRYVEQTMAGEPNEARLAEAVIAANLWLAAHGRPGVDPKLVRIAVESAVLEIRVQLAGFPVPAVEAQG